MLRNFRPGRATLKRSRCVPPWIIPLLRAAEEGKDLTPIIARIAALFGFDSFMYGASLSPRPGHEGINYVHTTCPDAWVARYDERGYIEVDPRLLFTLDAAIPFIWDQNSERGRSAATDAFLDDAKTHGIASGVAIAVFSSVHGHVIVAFNSSKPEIDELREIDLAARIGDLTMLAIYIHEAFMRTEIALGLPPRSVGRSLTRQEKRCLVYCAHGLSNKEIARRLRITERAVEWHFGNLRGKLDVATREEAVAKAARLGIIRHGELEELTAAEEDLARQRTRESKLPAGRSRRTSQSKSKSKKTVGAMPESRGTSVRR